MRLRATVAPPGRRHVGAILAVGMALLLSGCIVIPMNAPVASSRQNVTEATQHELRNGETTLEQVILQFGEPDRISTDGRRLGYTQSRVRALWLLAVGGTGGVGGGEISRDNLLQLTFDENNRLSKSEFRKRWNEDFTMAEEDWSASDRLKEQELPLMLLQPRSRRAGLSTPPLHPLTVVVREAEDRRPTRDELGHQILFDVSADKGTCPDSLAGYLRQELIAEISLMGHQVADQQADITITPRLTRAWFRITPGDTWEFSAEVECDLVYSTVDSSKRSVTRHYAGRKYLHEVRAPEKIAVFNGLVLNEAFDDLLVKVRNDAIWQAWPGANP